MQSNIYWQYNAYNAVKSMSGMASNLCEIVSMELQMDLLWLLVIMDNEYRVVAAAAAAAAVIL